MKTQEFVNYLNTYLNVGLFKDFAPNGLQVEGREEIRKIILGVTACQSLIDYAVDQKADAILVHHGWFWKNEPAQVVGMKRRRLATLLAAEINLMAYHLPLDAHPEVGNNAELARRLGLNLEKKTGFCDLLNIGSPMEPTTIEDFVARVTEVLGRSPLLVGRQSGIVKKIGWCTGAAQDELLEAVEEGCDLFLSGEISERTTYEAVENDVTYLAAGHHATERFGIQALGNHLKEVFPELQIEYLESNNIV